MCTLRRAGIGLLMIIGFSHVASAQQPAPKVEKYVFHFQGGNLPSNAAYVLQLLSQGKLLEFGSTGLEQGETLCTVYLEKTHFPGGCTQNLINLAWSMNRVSASPQQIPRGSSIIYPTVQFEKREYAKQYDLTVQADRAALANDRKVSGTYMTKDVKKEGQFVEHTFDAYRLTVELPNDAATKALLEKLQGHPGIYVAAAPPAAPVNLRLHSRAANSMRRQQGIPPWCNKPDAEEHSYAKFLGVDALPNGDCTTRRCAEIVLVDRPISPHWEIALSLDGLQPPAAPASPPVLKCDDPELLGNNFHGTHLAGIIASVRNGVAFAGLHPGAKLFPKAWPELGEVGLADEVSLRRNRVGLQIYVFASEWRLGPALANGDRLKKPANRFEHLVARAIQQRLQDLWIVAAGQPVDTDPPVQIDANLNRSPMNLGDLRNVIVVTGCDRCGRDPSLWAGANFSRQFVHLAAPAEVIVSTATSDSFTWAQGTSQATAFVAGVASAMVSIWPDHYTTAERVKERLQYTATPFAAAADRGRIAAGVVNPKLALLDPDRDYLDTTDPAMTDIEPTQIAGWCSADLTMTSSRGANVGGTDISRVYRIVQLSGEQGRQWIVFTEQPWQEEEEERKSGPGVVFRLGPGTPVVSPYEGRPPSRPLLKKMDGTVITVEQIEDLLVRPGQLKVVPCR